jgi:putative phosphoribosyl transferase
MRDSAPFRDREQAAELLAAELADCRVHRPLVLALPRGGVPMARLIADALDGDLDIVQVRKVGAPWNAELAVAAIDETGRMLVADHARECGADRAWLEQAGERELARMRQRRALWTPGQLPIDPAGRLVIVVDDGIATGTTMRAALRAIRLHRPAELICAVAVAPADGIDEVAAEADRMVCLLKPEWFGSVGMWFRDFHQVSDADVAAILARSPPRRSAAVLRLIDGDGH